MPSNGLNHRKFISLTAGLAAVIIIAVAALATHQTEEAALPVSQPEVSAPVTTPVKSTFGSIVWHESTIPAPSTPFKNGAGTEVSLLNFKGKVLVVNLWATWCAPCVKEMPTLDNSLPSSVDDNGPLNLTKPIAPARGRTHSKRSLYFSIKLSSKRKLRRMLVRFFSRMAPLAR